MVASLLGCGLIFPSDRLRHRITVEVETPYGLRTGSSVVETKVEEGKSWGDASGTSFYLKGEAVAVDLPNNKTLFALLRGITNGDAAGYQTGLILDALYAGAKTSPAINKDGLNLMEVRAAASAAKLQFDLPVSLYPMFVTFRNTGDQLSVEQLVSGDDFSAKLGPGIRIKRVHIEIVNAPVTDEISSRLPWVNIRRENSLDDRDPTPTPTPTIAQLVRRSDFRRY